MNSILPQRYDPNRLINKAVSSDQAQNAQKAVQKIHENLKPHIDEIKNKWNNISRNFSSISNMTGDDFENGTIQSIKNGTKVVKKILVRVNNDPELQENAKEVAQMLGVSAYEANKIILDTIVQLSPQIQETLLRSIKLILPALEIPKRAVLGVVRGALDTFPPAAELYNLIVTSYGLLMAVGNFTSKGNKALESVIDIGDASADVLARNTGNLKRILENVATMIQKVAEMSEKIKNEESAVTNQIGGAPATPNIPYVTAVPLNPSLEDVVNAWIRVTMSPLDVIDTQKIVNKADAQLQDDLFVLRHNIPYQVKDFEDAILVTKNFIQKKPQGAQEKRFVNATRVNTVNTKIPTVMARPVMPSAPPLPTTGLAKTMKKPLKKGGRKTKHKKGKHHKKYLKKRKKITKKRALKKKHQKGRKTRNKRH
jgi:hypothetical protein